METKPRVFLSHSSKDKELIMRIANDLRACRIDSWYAEWEIPVGESFRKKIFEDGIPGCDVFFVYLIPNSINSYWVEKELDGAFIKESKEKNIFILPFVDSDETREKLSLELRAVHSPIISLESEEEYHKGLLKLVTAIFRSKIKIVADKKDLKIENRILELEKENLTLKNEIQGLRNSTSISFEKLHERLNGIEYDLWGVVISSLTVFKQLALDATVGLHVRTFEDKIKRLWSTLYDPSSEKYNINGNSTPNISGTHLTRDLILHSLVSSVNLAKNDHYKHWNKELYLTDQGKKFAIYLQKQGLM